MATGYTTTTVLSDSIDDVINGARIVREQEGVMSQLVERQQLGKNMGNSWDEISLGKLTAQTITELTDLQNYQQMADTKFTITPTMIGCATVITDKVRNRLSKQVLAKMGALVQNAMQRKKDEDLLVMLDGFTSLAGAGVTLHSGYISAAKTAITSNATEMGKPPIRCVLHGFQIHDLFGEATAGVGTYPIGEGMTATIFREGFAGRINGAEIFEDGNITIDSSDDAKGGVFARDAIVLVEGTEIKILHDRKNNLGGGADVLYQYDDFAAGERSAGNWGREIYSDATAPTS